MSELHDDVSWARGADEAWWDLDRTSRRVGRYVWFERRMFGILGEWVVSAERDDLRVELARQSRERGDLAMAWTAQLPAHVAADHAALTASPSAEVAEFVDRFERITRSDEVLAVAVLRDRLLPNQREVLEEHVAVAAPVSDGPVIDVLRGALSMVARHHTALLAGPFDVAGLAAGVGDEWSLTADL